MPDGPSWYALESSHLGYALKGFCQPAIKCDRDQKASPFLGDILFKDSLVGLKKFPETFTEV
jgi:hypothetical protein